MFIFIKNSVAWISIPLIAIFIFSTIKEVVNGTNDLLFQSLVFLTTWVVFAILALIVGISNSLCFKRAQSRAPKIVDEGTRQQILRQQEALSNNRISALKNGGIISFVLFVIFGLMTTPVLPILPIEPNWYFLSTLIVCWFFGIFGYNSLVKNLTQ